MKTLTMIYLLLAVLSGSVCSCSGQTGVSVGDKNSFDTTFLKAMESKVKLMDSSLGSKALEVLTADFERIALAEEKQWLPFYYAALGHIKLGTMMAGQSKDKMDERADKGEKMLNKAIELSGETSETWILKSMVATLRLIADPMSRWQEYGQQSSDALNKAEKLNPGNPRVFVLKGEDKFYTPEEYGGNKKQAKVFFEKAIKLFATFKPQSTIHPSWGITQTHTNLSQIK